MRQEEVRRNDPIRPLEWRKMAPFEPCAASDRCFGDGACLEAWRKACFGQLDSIWL
jgi:hypothetical protein